MTPRAPSHQGLVRHDAQLLWSKTADPDLNIHQSIAGSQARPETNVSKLPPVKIQDEAASGPNKRLSEYCLALKSGVMQFWAPWRLALLQSRAPERFARPNALQSPLLDDKTVALYRYYQLQDPLTGCLTQFKLISTPYKKKKTPTSSNRPGNRRIVFSCWLGDRPETERN